MLQKVAPNVELDWWSVFGAGVVFSLTTVVTAFYIDNLPHWVMGAFFAGAVSSVLARNSGCSSNSAAVGIILPPVCFSTGVILWEILFGGIGGKEVAVVSAAFAVGGLPFLIILLIPLGLMAYISAAMTDFLRQKLRHRGITADFR
jgi:hypothetical protein